MSTFKNLEDIEYQVYEDKTIKTPFKDHTPLIFIFKDKITGKFGIPIPDFSQKSVETYSKRFIETMIFEIFDDKTKGYFSNKQMYVQTSLTKKEIHEVKKCFKNQYAKEKNLIRSLRDVRFNFNIDPVENLICCDIVEENVMNEKINDSVRLEEYKFLLGICGFVYENERFICIDKSENIESIKSTLIRFGAYF